jgi:hypothetical protein
MWEQFKAKFRTEIWNNEQIVKARQKFAELDSTTQSYVVIGSFTGFVLILLVSFFTLWGRTIAMKNEIAGIEETTRYVQASAVKIQELQEQASNDTADPMLEGFDAEAALPALLEAAGAKSLIAKPNVTVTDSGDHAEVKLNRISLTQLVRMLYLLEQSGANAVVDHLNVDAKDDTQGYLWASISVRRGGKK